MNTLMKMCKISIETHVYVNNDRIMSSSNLSCFFPKKKSDSDWKPCFVLSAHNDEFILTILNYSIHNPLGLVILFKPNKN